MQFNKRDLSDIKPLDEIRRTWKEIPTFPAVAKQGEGVLETFRELLRLLFRHLDGKHGFQEHFEISEEKFLAGVFNNLG